jgi:hypothetical protein
MEFRLIYEGPLPAATNSARIPEKHAIRKQIHKRLKELWRVRAPLAVFSSAAPQQFDMLKQIAKTYARAGFDFIPLVSQFFGLACSLDILFLRRENPGKVITQGGDLDNRIKTLFDALRMPKDGSELPSGAEAEFAGEYFYCLLQDDALVTDFIVTTDRLLGPLREGETENDVYLVIKVVTTIVDHSVAYVEFG